MSSCEHPTVLKIEDVSKSFGDLKANDSISFSLKQGEIVALLGENGAGKSTLMNILFGQYTADEGKITAFGKELPSGNSHAAIEAGIGMVHQHFTLAENLSVLDNIVLGTQPMWKLSLQRAQSAARIQTLSDQYGLEVDPHARVGTFSVGEKQRVEIMNALYRDVRVLILDEPTAVLTPQETDKLFATLKVAVQKGMSIIFISHKLHEVMAVSDRVLILRHGKLVAERDVLETSREELASLMVGDEVEAPKIPDAKKGTARFELKHISTSGGEDCIDIHDINLTLRGGEIVAIAGVSGNGQSTLADLISGLIKPSSGVIQIEEAAFSTLDPRRALNSRIARIPEDRHKTGTIAEFNLTENAILEKFQSPPFSKSGWLNKRVAEDFTDEIIQKYDVRGAGKNTPIRLLSGGNMQKLILGRVLEADPIIILAVQPVRGLDIGAVNYVHEQLLEARAQGNTVLLISEDLEEVMFMGDVIHVMYEGLLSPPFVRGSKTRAELGNYMAGQGFDESLKYAH